MLSSVNIRREKEDREINNKVKQGEKEWSSVQHKEPKKIA